MELNEDKVRAIVKEEFDKLFFTYVEATVKEMNLLIEGLRQHDEIHERKFQEMEKELSGLKDVLRNLVEVSEKNTNEIREQGRRLDRVERILEQLVVTVQELAKRTEENTKAIEELRKRTEENTDAIKRLEMKVEKLVIEIDKLTKLYKELSLSVGGLENTVGMLTEELVNRDLPVWLLREGVQVSQVKGKTILRSGRELEFDFYVEVDNKVYLGEIKTTLRERDVREFMEKVDLMREIMKGRDVNPVIVFRISRGESPIVLAKDLGIKVLKYVKGGDFLEK